MPKKTSSEQIQSETAEEVKFLPQGRFMKIAELGNPEKMFEALIHPMKLDDFYSKYYEKQPLVLKRHDANFFNGLFTLDSFLHEVEHREEDIQAYEEHMKGVNELVAEAKAAAESYHKLEQIAMNAGPIYDDDDEADQKKTKNKKMIKALKAQGIDVSKEALARERAAWELAQERADGALKETMEVEPPQPLLYGKNLNVVVHNEELGARIDMNLDQNPNGKGAPQAVINKLSLLRSARRNGTEIDDEDLERVAGDSADGDDEDDVSPDDEPVDVSKLEGLSLSEALEALQAQAEMKERAKKIVRVGDVEDLLRAGCTLQAIHPQQYSNSVWRVLYLLECYFGGLVGSNCYITPAGSQGLAPHHDDVEVFVCQLEGSKRWRLYKPIDPLAEGCSGDLDRHLIGQPHIEVVLEPGDLLYMPRGTIHEAMAQEELSSHLTISAMQGQNWGKLLQVAMEGALEALKRDTLDAKQSLPLHYQAFLGTLHDESIVPNKDFMSAVNQGHAIRGTHGPHSHDDEDEDGDEDGMDEDAADEDAEEDADEDNAGLADEDDEEDGDEDAEAAHMGGMGEDEDDMEMSGDMPLYVMGDVTGVYNRAWLTAGNVNPEKRAYLKKLKQQQAEGTISTLMQQLMQRINIHAAADEIARDFAMHRLPPPPSLQDLEKALAEGMPEEQDEDNEEDEDVEDEDAEEQQDEDEEEESIEAEDKLHHIASRASVLNDRGVTVSGKGKREVIVRRGRRGRGR